MNQNLKFSQKCIDLISSEEGLILHPYLDSVGVPTIGYGTTHYCNGVKVTMEDKVITKEVAQQNLMCYLTSIALPCILKSVKANINQNMLDALGDFVYNEGCTNFQTSHLLRYINIESTPDVIKDAWMQWIYANHKPLEDLKRRRQHEITLFYS